MSEELLNACRNGNFDVVNALFLDSQDIHYKDNGGMTALMCASLYGALDIVKYLLTSDDLIEHANIHEKSKHGYNSLMYACFNGHLDIMKYLLTSNELKEHADIHCCDNNSLSVLLYACIKGHLDVIEYLLTSKELKEHANLYDKSNDNTKGLNALMCACHSQKWEIVQYLIVNHNMVIDKKTMNWLVKEDKQEVLDIIAARDLYQKMNDDLSTNDKIVRQRKI